MFLLHSTAVQCHVHCSGTSSKRVYENDHQQKRNAFALPNEARLAPRICSRQRSSRWGVNWVFCPVRSFPRPIWMDVQRVKYKTIHPVERQATKHRNNLSQPITASGFRAVVRFPLITVIFLCHHCEVVLFGLPPPRLLRYDVPASPPAPSVQQEQGAECSKRYSTKCEMIFCCCCFSFALLFWVEKMIQWIHDGWPPSNVLRFPCLNTHIDTHIHRHIHSVRAMEYPHAERFGWLWRI